MTGGKGGENVEDVGWWRLKIIEAMKNGDDLRRERKLNLETQGNNRRDMI